MVKVRKDLTGEKYGRLTVLKQSEEDYIKPDGRREARWICECSCPEHNIVIKTTAKLKNSLHPSCGCWGDEIRRENGIKNVGNILRHRTQNQYDLSGDYGVGYTSDGSQFIFDLEDYDLIKDYKWYVGNNGYLYGRSDNTQHVLFHRLVMNAPDNYFIDHRQHNLLDNRKQFLRIVTCSQNGMNKEIQINNTSGYTGVYYHKPSNNWCAYIKVNNKQIKKYCKTKEEAIQKRQQLERVYFGEYSYKQSMDYLANRKDIEAKFD